VKLLYGAEMVKEMLLVSNRVLPPKLLNSGFTFLHTDLVATLGELIKKGL
jgi:NAD dependent epimerase/dehydratase family enzyme